MEIIDRNITLKYAVVRNCEFTILLVIRYKVILKYFVINIMF